LKQRCRHRQKVSLIAALTISPQRSRLGLYFHTLPLGSFKGDSIASFLSDLLRHIRGKIIIIWDRWSAHGGKPIKALLARNPRVTIERLPPYAPELNPVEQIWTHLKWGQLANYIPQSADDLNEAATPILQAAANNQGRLHTFFQGAKLSLPRRR
jgi:putative transposase